MVRREVFVGIDVAKAHLDVATPLRHKDGRRFEVSLRQKRNEGLNNQRPSKHLRDPGADRTVSCNPTNRVISSFSRKLRSRHLRSIRYRLDGPKARKSKPQIAELLSPCLHARVMLSSTAWRSESDNFWSVSTRDIVTAPIIAAAVAIARFLASAGLAWSK